MRCSCGHENPESAQQCAHCGKALRDQGHLRRTLVDAGAGLGLLLALAMVFAVGGGSRSGEPGPEGVGNGAVHLASRGGPARRDDRPLRLAVTPKEYDDMGKLLDTLGEGYRWDPIEFDDLLDPAFLAQYDVVFLTCGSAPRHWVGQFMGRGRRGTDLHVLRPLIKEQLIRGLRDYVAQGGTLYASDWRLKMLALAFPEYVDFRAAAPGAVQTIEAEVLDPPLQRRVGETIDLRFDKASWYPAAFEGDEVIPYLRGEYKTTAGDMRTMPLLVRVPHGSGSIIFTSFHNEKQHNQTEEELLRYLVFASVMARENASVRRSLVEGGFSPVEGNLLTASAGDQSVTRTYRVEEPGDVQFVLAFQNRGATLRLSVRGPDGGLFEETGQATFTINVPDAAAGDWQYTITPVEIPHRNFPFSLTVGQKGSR